MKEYIMTENEKLNFLKDTDKDLSKEEAEFITGQIIINSKEIKLNILLMKMNRGYISLGYSDFKSYVNSKLPFNYDAIVKQMIAAATAMKLFGAEKVGFYSDSSMITLNSLHFEMQVKVVINLKEKFGKAIDEDLEVSEMTKKVVCQAIKSISSKDYNLIKSKLSADVSDEDYSFYTENFAIQDFYVADEEAFFKKYGFSRWDARSLSLKDADKLENISREELHYELSTRWSVVDIMVHINTFHKEYISGAQAVCSQYGHRSLVNYVCNLYHQSSDKSESEIDSKGNEDEHNHGSGEDIQNSDQKQSSEEPPALDAEFFLDAEDSSTIHQFKKKRDKLRKKIFTAAENDYNKKNPKASLIMAIGDLLDEEEIFATIKYYIEIYNSIESDSEDNEQNDSDNFDEDNSWDEL